MNPEHKALDVSYILDDNGKPLEVGGGDVLAVVEGIPDDPVLAFTAAWNSCRAAMLAQPQPANPAQVTDADLDYGLKLIAEAIEAHFGDRDDAYKYEMGDTTIHDAWEAYDALTAAIGAGGQAVVWQWRHRAKRKDGTWCEWSGWFAGRRPALRTNAYESEERPLYTQPAPSGQAVAVKAAVMPNGDKIEVEYPNSSEWARSWTTTSPGGGVATGVQDWELVEEYGLTAILSALSQPHPADERVEGNPVELSYTNYRGDTARRTITPKRIWFGSTDWHPEPQWLLTAYDHGKGADRDFALKDFGTPPAAPADERVVEALRSLLTLTKFELADNVKRQPWARAIEKAEAALAGKE